MKAILNAGLNVGNKLTWDVDDVLIALLSGNHNYLRYTVKPSATENTAVIELETPLSKRTAEDLCYWLNQDCVAQQLEDGSGMLYGPKAEEWGSFNPEYFLNFDTENQDEND